MYNKKLNLSMLIDFIMIIYFIKLDFDLKAFYFL